MNSVVEHKIIPYRIATASKCKGDVLEIGAGTGANIDFIAKVDSFSAVEPDAYMRRKLLRTSLKTNLDVNIFDHKGEDLKFPDNSFDSVFTTLVLCMVTDVEKVVSEAYRVLKPGGTFYFYEHVVSDKDFGHFFQKILNPIWKWGSTGCHLDRDIKKNIETVPFKKIVIEEFSLGFPLRISIPNILGYAIK